MGLKDRQPNALHCGAASLGILSGHKSKLSELVDSAIKRGLFDKFRYLSISRISNTKKTHVN